VVLAGGRGVGGRPEGSGRVCGSQSICVCVVGRQIRSAVVIGRRRKSSRVVAGQLGGC
jgi:hypothetical protein